MTYYKYILFSYSLYSTTQAPVIDDSTYVLRKYDHGLAVLRPDREQAPSDERSGASNSVPHYY